MKTLDKNEWVVVIVAIAVVGFFFVFGQTLVSVFTSTKTQNAAMVRQSLIAEDSMGTGEIAQAGDRVVVNYTGRFKDGTIFDSSDLRNEPYQFILGVGQVIKGWDQGIVGMRVGGTRTLTVPPELGYGMTDYGPIPGGSTLIFDIELLKVEKSQ